LESWDTYSSIPELWRNFKEPSLLRVTPEIPVHLQEFSGRSGDSEGDEGRKKKEHRMRALASRWGRESAHSISSFQLSDFCF
jgi:hypothetical protein